MMQAILFALIFILGSCKQSYDVSKNPIDGLNGTLGDTTGGDSTGGTSGGSTSGGDDGGTSGGSTSGGDDGGTSGGSTNGGDDGGTSGGSTNGGEQPTAASCQDFEKNEVSIIAVGEIKNGSAEVPGYAEFDVGGHLHYCICKPNQKKPHGPSAVGVMQGEGHNSSFFAPAVLCPNYK